MKPARWLAALWHFPGVIYMFQHCPTVRTLQTEVLAKVQGKLLICWTCGICFGMWSFIKR